MIRYNPLPEAIVQFKNDTFHIQYREGVLINEDVLIRGIQCRKNLTGDQPVFLLMDMSLAADITECALAFAAEHPHPENVIAIAVITRGGRDHLRAKLYASFDNPNILTRPFLSVDEAKQWLLTLEQGQVKRVA